jgi:predicted nuclease with TOPRIM domain
MIMNGNVIADMQSEMEAIRRRLEAVESELARLREGLRGEQGRHDPKWKW